MNIFKSSIILLSAALTMWGCDNSDDSENGIGDSISLSTSVIQMDRNGGESSVTVTSSGDWRIAGACDWAIPSATSGKSGEVVTFTIDANADEEARTVTFKFFTGSAVAPLKIESNPNYTLNLLSDANISITNEENTNIQVQFDTNIADISIDYSDNGGEWLTVSNIVEFAGKTTIIFAATENEKYVDRSTTISFSNPLIETPVTVQLTQARTEAIIPEKELFTFGLDATEVSFQVKANVEYEISVTEGESWITDQQISTPQEGEDGLSTVTVTYKLSEATDTRGGIINIAATESSLNTQVAIVQKDENTELATIPDDVLRSHCESQGWILSLAGAQCVILEQGLTATTLDYYSYSNRISDLTGIENFPELTNISLYYISDMTKLDISGLHKVSTLSFYSPTKCTEYNLGDNPISSFNIGGQYTYVNTNSLTIISSKVETIDLSVMSWYQDYDNVTSIDVSQCPALKTLNANRGAKVKTLYMSESQKETVEVTKNDATEIVYK